MLGTAVPATTSAGTAVARNSFITFMPLDMFACNAFVGAAGYPVAMELVSTGLGLWTVRFTISLGYFLT